MTSKIKVDNIENQCGGAVVTKCGATTTISGSVVKADDIQAADGGNLINQCGTTITLGASGDTINLASGASQTGFGRTGTVDWDTTPKTSTFSAVSGNGYFCNTSGGAFTVNLPAGSAGAIVSLADYAATWQTNNLTVAPNGTDKIGSVNADTVLSTEGQSVTFVYVDSTQGWINTMDSTSNVRGNTFITATGGTITTVCTDYKVHTFTGPGTFTVCSTSNTPDNNLISYAIVAGGGGGVGGGGGAGGFREVKSPTTPYTASPLDGYSTPGNRVTVTATGYPIIVGGGGTGVSVGTNSAGTLGSNSTGLGITSTGGGGGALWGNSSFPQPHNNGGSGGGGGQRSGPGGGAGNGNTPPTSPSQGNNGGASQANPGETGGAGGGGGASATGTTGTCGVSGPGGNGVATSITGSSVTRAGGGGGGGRVPGSTAGSGGTGGGGNGIATTTPAGTAGTDNTGGGGGGGGYSASCGTGGNGGSGTVIIRYKFQ